MVSHDGPLTPQQTPQSLNPPDTLSANDSPSRRQRWKSVFSHSKKHSRPSSSLENAEETELATASGDGYRLGGSRSIEPHRANSLFIERRTQSSMEMASGSGTGLNLGGPVSSIMSNAQRQSASGSREEERPLLGDSHEISLPSSSTSVRSQKQLAEPIDDFSSYTDYLIDLLKSRWQHRLAVLDPCSEEANKARQLRLILFEFLEHVDFLTDALLVLRLLSDIVRPYARQYEKVAAVLLTGVLITSTVAYFTRRHNIVHKITGTDQWIFCPGPAFFYKVRHCGKHNHGVLLQYERLQWTYTLVMRFLEDIPQLMVVLCLLAQDAGILLVLDASTSLMTLVASSFRLGTLYPYKSSLALLISSAPPLDSPLVLEASPTTRRFPWLLSFTFLIMGICHMICSGIARNQRLQSWFYFTIALVSFGIAFISALYASYLTRQYEEYTNHEEDVVVEARMGHARSQEA